jgi:hypothetical protein
MLHRYRPEPWHQCKVCDPAIHLVEDYVALAEGLSARLAKAGRVEDAAYARVLLELGRNHLDLLRWHRQELLSPERPPE